MLFMFEFFSLRSINLEGCFAHNVDVR